jgi:hypothetical protein
MSNLFRSLDIEIWDFIGICLPAVLLAGCLEFEISEYLNTRESIFKNYLFIGYSTVKFYTSSMISAV